MADGVSAVAEVLVAARAGGVTVHRNVPIAAPAAEVVPAALIAVLVHRLGRPAARVVAIAEAAHREAHVPARQRARNRRRRAVRKQQLQQIETRLHPGTNNAQRLVKIGSRSGNSKHKTVL